jgi:hypothetical protein
VHPVQELRVVKTQADLHKTQTGKELTYDQYVNLLLSDASAYDAQFAPKTHFTARAPYRAVYSHDFTASNEDNDPGYDIDSALDVIQANGHSTRPPGTSMALTQLSQDAKDIWDKLTDEANGIILDRHRDSTRPPGRGSPRPPFATPTFTISVPPSWLTSMIFALKAREMSTTLRKRGRPYPLP